MSHLLTLHDPERSRRFYEAGYWQPDSFYALLKRNAEHRPDAFFLRDSNRRLCYRDALEWVDALAEKMANAGLVAGNRVAISSPNRIEVPLIFLACSRDGYVCNPSLHQNYTTSEIIGLLERISATAFFALPGYGVDGQFNDRADAATKVASVKRVFRLGAAGDPGDVRIDTSVPLSDPIASPDKIVYLAFTSGTTGRPKAVIHSDNTLLSNARSMVADWGHDQSMVLFSMSPMSHHNGWVALGQTLVAGGEIVLNDLPKGAKPLDRIIETGTTYLMGVPTHAIDLVAEIRKRGLGTVGRLKTWYIAGSTIPPEISKAIWELGVKPQNVYGMTENSSHQYTLPTDSFEVSTSTCGRANPGYEVAIFDPANPSSQLAAGEVGEIGGRGACLMLGYFDDQTATERSFNEKGWFMTGDLGVIDKDGCLKIVGRSKDLIIRGGHNIYPSEIENLALTHPKIQKAAAFGVDDARLGERVCLALTFTEGCVLSNQEILQHLQDHALSKYNMPEYLLPLSSLPMTASGKILKRELVAGVRNGTIKPTAVR
jgi:acyl-CoA synthetase